MEVVTRILTGIMIFVISGIIFSRLARSVGAKIFDFLMKFFKENNNSQK